MPRDFRISTNTSNTRPIAVNINIPTITQKKKKKRNWPVVSARISPELRDIINIKYKKRGDISELIYKLLTQHVWQQP